MMDKLAIRREKDALLVVDIQNDFCPGGALPVESGDSVIPIINKLTPMFHTNIFSRDWHPKDHCSFSSDPEYVDKSWPVHCVADTEGAAFHSDLHIPLQAIFINKATQKDMEAYSAFQGTGLKDTLKNKLINRLFITGLATDYCVLHTALDAVREGFEVIVVTDAIRGIDIPKGTVQAAIDSMKKSGVQFIISNKLSS